MSKDGLSSGRDDGDSCTGSASASSSSPEKVFQFSPSSPTEEGTGCAGVQAGKAAGEESGFESDFDGNDSGGEGEGEGEEEAERLLHQEHDGQHPDSAYGDLIKHISLVSRGTHPLQKGRRRLLY